MFHGVVNNWQMWFEVTVYWNSRQPRQVRLMMLGSQLTSVDLVLCILFPGPISGVWRASIGGLWSISVNSFGPCTDVFVLETRRFALESRRKRRFRDITVFVIGIYWASDLVYVTLLWFLWIMGEWKLMVILACNFSQTKCGRNGMDGASDDMDSNSLMKFLFLIISLLLVLLHYKFSISFIHSYFHIWKKLNIW